VSSRNWGSSIFSKIEIWPQLQIQWGSHPCFVLEPTRIWFSRFKLLWYIMNLNTVCLPWKARLDKLKREELSWSETTGNTELTCPKCWNCKKDNFHYYATLFNKNSRGNSLHKNWSSEKQICSLELQKPQRCLKTFGCNRQSSI